MFLIPASKLTVVWMLFTILALIDRHNRLINVKIANNLPKNHSHYDFIVVGAGTAGCIVACRLANETAGRVLLLEAGGTQHSLNTSFPALLDSYILESSVYWRVRNKFSNSFIGSGKLFGGSHSLNGMFYIRGSRNIYDSIYNKTGARGWAYDEVLPHYISNEFNTDPVLKDMYHGSSGPLGVTTQLHILPLFVAIEQALKSWGNQVVDVNGASDEGIARLQRTIRNGRRETTAAAYILNDNSRCPTLSIMTNSLVTKLLIQSSAKQQPNVYGIEFIKSDNSSAYRVYADNEIIISAGSLNTPKLLQLSGIGNAQLMTRLGIRPVWSDIPVGHNFMCHVSTFLGFSLKSESPIDNVTINHFYRALYGRTGPMTHSNALVLRLRLPSISSTDKDYDNNETIDYFVQIEFILSNYAGNQKLLCITITDLGDTTKGTLTIQSTDVREPPVAYYPYKTRDNRALLAAVQYVLKFVSSTSLSDFVHPIPADMDDCKPYITGPLWQCFEYHKCLIEKSTFLGHPIGTSPMGASDSADTVVDERLRVKGVTGLRVVDASIYPNHINGNTMAAAILAGEKGAHMIN
ncbi:glucose dehydrogenase [FAD, quinone]-like [Oppia nitens]|uniref:glucose dehydrogenase [FAD, quinone]-like n=1 Tax=Oppia nitens TaxID=1686743 RepID=UPI0023DCB4AD|nr:glucose dehydrogenase [FAD, quinone]-like [Oppia nitens]